MTDRSLESREADALQEALERHASLLAEGVSRVDARSRMASELGQDLAGLFSLAVGMGDAAASTPAPTFADAFEAKLRRTHVVTRQERSERMRRAQRRRKMLRFFEMPQFGFAAAAAAIAIFAGLLIPSFGSLPGESLYGLKRTAETARLAVVSGPREAHYRLQLAGTRFGEVEHLIERAQVKQAGPGLAALSVVQDIKDPRIARLIESTLADAQEQIEVAATILFARPANAQALDDLVDVSRRGQKLAAEVAEDLPAPNKPPVLGTVVTLAKIEAEAKAQRMTVEPSPTPPPPPPCATPTPTPTPEATDATATPSESSPTPSPEPTTTPEPTPCVSPEPTPTPISTPTPSPTPESASASAATPAPTPTDQQQQQGAGNAEQRRRAESNTWWTPPPESSGGPDQT